MVVSEVVAVVVRCCGVGVGTGDTGVVLVRSHGTGYVIGVLFLKIRGDTGYDTGVVDFLFFFYVFLNFF